MNIDKESLERLINESNTFNEVLTKIGLKTHTGARKTLLKYMKDYGIDDTGIRERSKIFSIQNAKNIRILKKIPDEKVFVENSTYNTGKSLKKRLINNGMKNECCLCGQKPFHNNLPLSLQLDHINGIHNDNRIENLRLLCPNCHTQTHTWGNKDRRKYTCEKCGSQTKGYSSICCKCSSINNIKKIDITLETLNSMLEKMPVVEVSKQLNVSDNTVRNICKRLGVNIPKYNRGYWIRKSEIYKMNKTQIENEIQQLSAYNVSKKYNCGYKEFKKYCKEIGIHLKEYNFSEITDDDITNVKKLKRDGLSNRSIATKMGVKRGRIDKIVKTYINGCED